MICQGCGRISVESGVCPDCGLDRAAGLSRSGDLEMLTDPDLMAIVKSRHGLANALTTQLTDELAQDLELPALPASLLDRSGDAPAGIGGLGELERLFEERALAPGSGLTLRDLMEGAPEQVRIVRTGTLLLRHGRAEQAAEWWNLQRRAALAHGDRFELLLLLLEALAHDLAKRPDRAAQLRSEARRLPAYAAYERPRRTR